MLLIKHERTASPACSAIDLCSSSSDLSEVQQPSFLLEDNPKQAAAALQPASSNRQQPPLAQQVVTSASPAMLSSASPAQPADQNLRQAGQGACTSDAVAHRHHHSSSQHQATVAHAQMPGRLPLHDPRLPERPQKRQRAAIESGAELEQTQDSCAVKRSLILSGNHRSTGSIPTGETHLQMPDLSHAANPEPQRLTARANQCGSRGPLLASTPSKAASTTQVKLERLSSQSSLIDLHEAPRASGRQSPAAAPLPHQGNILAQVSAVREEPDYHQLVEAELPMRSEASPFRTKLQQVLSLFAADAAVGLAAKESALTQLVMLVADSMYAPVFQPYCSASSSEIAHVCPRHVVTMNLAMIHVMCRMRSYTMFSLCFACLSTLPVRASQLCTCGLVPPLAQTRSQALFVWHADNTATMW